MAVRNSGTDVVFQFSSLAFGGREEYKGRETSDSKEEFFVSQF